MKGNGLIEVILWLTFIIPGIIYTIWRRNSWQKTCPSCGQNNLIPTDTPVGMKLLKDQDKNPDDFIEHQKPEDPLLKKAKRRQTIIGICVVVVFWIIYIALA